MDSIIGNLYGESSPGEKRIYGLLEKFFQEESSVYVYFEPDIMEGIPDFLCLSPKFGVIIIEIKDHKSETVLGNPYYVKKTNRQLFKYWRSIRTKIRVNDALKKEDVSITKVAVFSNIDEHSDAAVMISGLKGTFNHVLFKNQITNINVFIKHFERIIQSMQPTSREILNLLHVNFIPFARLPDPKQVPITKWFDNVEQAKLLDREQIKLAHELGSGHRIFYGVAGSGKTILLTARAKYLSRKHQDWDIIVLCYNKILSMYLEDLIRPEELGNVEVSTFHSFARRMIKNCDVEYSATYDTLMETYKEQDKLDEFYSRICPELLMKACDDVNPKCFNAILIDEGQDFEADWFRAILKLLNPKTNSLMITLDGLQGIYARKKIRWAHLGIDARGRVTKFRRSYRNAKEIGEAALKVLPKTMLELIQSDDDFLETEEFLGSSGKYNVFIYKNRRQEYENLCRVLDKLAEDCTTILVLTQYNLQRYRGDSFFLKMLDQSGVQYDFIDHWGTNGHKTYLSTLHSSKGLEADAVVIPCIDNYNPDDDAQLLYVGITRARKRLVITGIKENAIVKKIADTPR